MSEKAPHDHVRDLQKRVDDEKLLWFVALTEQFGELHYNASHRASNRVVIHRDPETLLGLIRDADARIPKAAVQVKGGLASTESIR